MPEKNKSLCPLAWSHVKMNVQGHITPCCVFDETKSPENMPSPPRIRDGVQASMESEYMQRIRERMNAGERLPECERCYVAEENGVDSHRLTWKRFDEFINTEPKVRFLETAFSTHCNMACRMCGEDFSSKWKLINNPGMSPDTTIANYDIEYYDFDFSELKIVKVLGGEPLLSKDHDLFLEKLVEKAKNPEEVALMYHTNGSIFPKPKIVELWKKVRTVVVALSIDGHGKLNEYLRPGAKWETIAENIEKFKQIENIHIKCCASINAMNIMHITDFCRWQVETFGSTQSMNIVTIPQYMAIENMTDDLKDRAKAELDRMVSEFPQTKSFSDWCYQVMDKVNGDMSFDKIAEYEKKLDNYFDQSFTDFNT